MNRCSRCGKRIWIWQNRWALGDVDKPPHDYWHFKCARPLHECGELNYEEANNYLRRITNFKFEESIEQHLNRKGNRETSSLKTY